MEYAGETVQNDWNIMNCSAKTVVKHLLYSAEYSGLRSCQTPPIYIPKEYAEYRKKAKAVRGAELARSAAVGADVVRRADDRRSAIGDRHRRR